MLDEEKSPVSFIRGCDVVYGGARIHHLRPIRHEHGIDLPRPNGGSGRAGESVTVPRRGIAMLVACASLANLAFAFCSECKLTCNWTVPSTTTQGPFKDIYGNPTNTIYRYITAANPHDDCVPNNNIFSACAVFTTSLCRTFTQQTYNHPTHSYGPMSSPTTENTSQC